MAGSRRAVRQGRHRQAARAGASWATASQDLYQRLVTVSEETDIPIGRLITRAIDAEVARHEDR